MPWLRKNLRGRPGFEANFTLHNLQVGPGRTVDLVMELLVQCSRLCIRT